jgi:hypothetical protein
METPKGDFLGLSSFGPNAKEAYAEFMVNKKLATFQDVVLVAKSGKGEEVRTPVKLELTEKPELERPGITADKRPPNKPVKEDKKKGKKFLVF